MEIGREIGSGDYVSPRPRQFQKHLITDALKDELMLTGVDVEHVLFSVFVLFSKASLKIPYSLLPKSTTMTRTKHHSHATPGFPVVCLGWADDSGLILGGGGGASRTGVKNKLVSATEAGTEAFSD